VGSAADSFPNFACVCLENIEHRTNTELRILNKAVAYFGVRGSEFLNAMSASFKKIADTLVGFIYPNVCQLCGGQRATSTEGFVCSHCWEQVRFIKPPFCQRCGLPFQGSLTTEFECGNCQDLKLHFRSARSAVKLDGAVREVIRRYKYNRALWFEPFLADLLIREALPDLRQQKWDYIVPVPLHPARIARSRRCIPRRGCLGSHRSAERQTVARC